MGVDLCGVRFKFGWVVVDVVDGVTGFGCDVEGTRLLLEDDDRTRLPLAEGERIRLLLEEDERTRAVVDIVVLFGRRCISLKGCEER